MYHVRHSIIPAVPLILASVVMGKTLHVPTADYPTIQAAIIRAGSGDKIMVSPGTYTENINFLGKAIHLRSRNNDPGDTIIHGTGSGSVVTCNSNETSNTILEGFTITGAYVSDYGRGGGMYNVYSSPTVTNCIFSNNTASGIYNWPGSPTVTNCAFNGNSGPGIFSFDSSLVVTDCTFVDNTGAGMSNRFSSAVVTDCAFIQNSGSGIDNNYSSVNVTGCTFNRNRIHGIEGSHAQHTVAKCTFSNNSHDGMANVGATVEVIDCEFIDNDVGMFNWGLHTDSVINRCIFRGNSAGMSNYENWMTMGVSDCLFSHNSGDGMQNYECQPFPLTNCTFSNNSGRAIYNDLSSPTVTNCILWYNAGGSIVGGSATVTYSAVEGGWDGEGNTDVNPLFVNPGAGDFHLAPASPCIDAGTNSPAEGLLSMDIEGNPRIVDGDHDRLAVVDMGAYEASKRQGP